MTYHRTSRTPRSYQPDGVDLQILALLREDGRMSIGQIAEHLRIGQSSISVRIRNLKENNVIKKFRAIVDYERLGFEVSALVEIQQTGDFSPEEIVKLLQGMPEVEHLLWIADGKALALVRTRGVDRLGTLLFSIKDGLPGVTVNSMIVTEVSFDKGGPEFMEM